MTGTDDLRIPIPDRRQVATFLVVLTRLMAAICWLGLFAVLSKVTPGALALLVATVLVSAAVFWAVHNQGSRSVSARAAPGGGGEQVGSRAVHRVGNGKIVAALGVYAAALCWIGAAMVMNNTGGVLLLSLPLLATFGMYAARNYLKRLTS